MASWRLVGKGKRGGEGKKMGGGSLIQQFCLLVNSSIISLDCVLLCNKHTHRRAQNFYAHHNDRQALSLKLPGAGALGGDVLEAGAPYDLMFPTGHLNSVGIAGEAIIT